MPPIIITKQRNSNLELYRIIVMLAIVAHHYVVNSGLTEVISEQYFSTPSLLLAIRYVGQNRHKLLCVDYRFFHVYFADNSTKVHKTDTTDRVLCNCCSIALLVLSL